MKANLERSTDWIYRGIWAVLVEWFRVPQTPPSLPAAADDQLQAFRPAEGFLRYLKFEFWILLAIIDIGILAIWLAVAFSAPRLGAVLALPALLIAVVPDIIAYIAIHLRYDTTWYVLGSRSLRIRRGIWVIRETTITYENVQNIKVTQGPLQRFFGIANVLVETAGGGSGQQQGHAAAGSMHSGLIEGVADAHQIRDLILARVRKSTSAGLGDEREEAAAVSDVRWTGAHLQVLEEIRDAALAAAGASL